MLLWTEGRQTHCEIKALPCVQAPFLPSSFSSSSWHLGPSGCPCSTYWSDCWDWRCSHTSSDVECACLVNKTGGHEKGQMYRDADRRTEMQKGNRMIVCSICKPFMLSGLFKAPCMTAWASSFLVLRASMVSRSSISSESYRDLLYVSELGWDGLFWICEQNFYMHLRFFT